MSGVRHDTLATLVRMANQIARFFESQEHESSALGFADHVAAFWSRRMRQDILAHLDAGGDGLRPLAAQGLSILRDRAPKRVSEALEAHGGVSVGTERGSDAG